MKILKGFYFQYQTEALPYGESLQSFCVKNKVPYYIFQKWYKDTREKVIEVQIDCVPETGHEKNPRQVINLNRYHKDGIDDFLRNAGL